MSATFGWSASCAISAAACAREISVRLQSDEDPARRRTRHLSQARGNIISRLCARCARLYFVWEDTDERCAERGGEIAILDSDFDLLAAFTCVGRIERARSIDTTDCQVLIKEFAPRRLNGAGLKLRSPEQIQVSAHGA